MPIMQHALRFSYTQTCSWNIISTSIGQVFVHRISKPSTMVISIAKQCCSSQSSTTKESNFIQTTENLLLLWTTTYSVDFIESTEFLMMCNAWLQKEPEEYLADITDGMIWKEMMSLISSDRSPTNTVGLLVNVAVQTRNILRWCDLCCSNKLTKIDSLQR